MGVWPRGTVPFLASGHPLAGLQVAPHAGQRQRRHPGRESARGRSSSFLNVLPVCLQHSTAPPGPPAQPVVRLWSLPCTWATANMPPDRRQPYPDHLPAQRRLPNALPSFTPYLLPLQGPCPWEGRGYYSHGGTLGIEMLTGEHLQTNFTFDRVHRPEKLLGQEDLRRHCMVIWGT